MSRGMYRLPNGLFTVLGWIGAAAWPAFVSLRWLSRRISGLVIRARSASR